ncbi:hypothetical protein ACEE16_07425 [Streptococcus suis]
MSLEDKKYRFLSDQSYWLDISRTDVNHKRTVYIYKDKNMKEEYIRKLLYEIPEGADYIISDYLCRGEYSILFCGQILENGSVSVLSSIHRKRTGFLPSLWGKFKKL